MPSREHINPQILTQALLWSCVLLTGYYFFDRLITQETFGFHDWYVFIDHAQTFVSKGMLYDRDLTLYGPAAATYKFPPLYASILVLFLNCGFSQEAINQIVLVTYLFCYFLSIIVCLGIAQYTKRRVLIPLSLIIAFTFEPFFDNYISAQMEIYILLLLSLSLLFHLKGRDVWSGFFIGIATAIKIYPIYFAGYYLVHKKYSAIVGIISGILLASVFSLALTGWAEHVFYFFHVLPTLLTENISNKGENISIARLLLAINMPMKTAEYLSLIILLMPIVIVLIFSTFNRHSSKPENLRIWFAIFITTLLLATKNSWWNYQILLTIPLLVIVGALLERTKTAYFFIAILLIAYFMIFWCNLGKLEILILFFTRLLDASAFLTAIMLKINLLRGLATFLILLTLVFLLYVQRQKNISLVENRSST